MLDGWLDTGVSLPTMHSATVMISLGLTCCQVLYLHQINGCLVASALENQTFLLCNQCAGKYSLISNNVGPVVVLTTITLIFVKPYSVTSAAFCERPNNHHYLYCYRMGARHKIQLFHADNVTLACHVYSIYNWRWLFAISKHSCSDICGGLSVDKRAISLVRVSNSLVIAIGWCNVSFASQNKFNVLT